MRVCLRIIVVCLVSLQANAAPVQTSSIQARINKLLRTVVPIKTTDEQVKKLVGEPIRTSPDFHELDDFNVLVSYTTGLPCEKEPTYGWNVPRGRVNTFTIIIKASFHQSDLKDLGIDLKEYEKAEGDGSLHAPETIYTSNEKGTRIYINGDQITSISLFTSKKNLDLKCRTKGTRTDSSRRTQPPPIW